MPVRRGVLAGYGFDHGDRRGLLVGWDLLPWTAGQLLKMGTPSWCDLPVGSGFKSLVAHDYGCSLLRTVARWMGDDRWPVAC
ncbi:hypothetical protein ACLOJK_037413 [Asimina triloba]